MVSVVYGSWPQPQLSVCGNKVQLLSLRRMEVVPRSRQKWLSRSTHVVPVAWHSNSTTWSERLEVNEGIMGFLRRTWLLLLLLDMSKLELGLYAKYTFPQIQLYVPMYYNNNNFFHLPAKWSISQVSFLSRTQRFQILRQIVCISVKHYLT